MRRVRLIVLIWLTWMLFSVNPLAARGVLEGDTCLVEADETVDGTLFAVCRDLVIEGRVSGSVFALAIDARISGRVDGSVYIGAWRTQVDGEIGGSLHFGGAALDIISGADFDSEQGSIVSAAISTLIGADRIPASVTSIGYQLTVTGAVAGEVNFWGTALTLEGQIDGDVYAEVGDPQSTGVLELGALLSPLDVRLAQPGLLVTEDAAVGGQLIYRSVAEGTIAGTLANDATFIPYERAILIEQPTDLGQGLRNYLAQVAREFITLGLVGLVTLLLLPRILQAPLDSIRWRPIPSLGIGLLTFILSFPIFLIVLAISIVLILVVGLARLSDLTAATAVLLGVVNFSGAGLFYFVAIFISRVIVGVAIGRLLARWLWQESTSLRAWIVSLGVGLLVLALLASLPLIGWILNALAAFLGLGSIITYIQQQLDRVRESSASAQTRVTVGIPTGAPPLPDDPPYHRPVLPAPSMPDFQSDAPNGPGMDNLPDGFSWWE